jgi:DNA-binding response OmpR family regulator
VDDHVDLLDNLALSLETAGFSVFAAKDGMEALSILKESRVDLILADIAMPRMNGYQLYERVREEPDWITIPFVFLTARALDSDIRYGKELGVDDYLTKPIQPEDLLAAVRGKLRRANQLARSGSEILPYQQDGSGTLEIGRLKIEPDQHQVWLDGESIKLSAREFKVLVTMAQQAGNVVSPVEIIRITHDLDTDHVEAGSLLRPLIRSLRRKLGFEVGDMGFIENIRGVGYRIVPPES